MDTAAYQKATTPSLDQRPSVRFLAPQDPTDGAVTVPPSGPRLSDGGEPDAQPIVLGLAIRRRRLILFTVAMLAFIVGIAVWFRHGMALTHFETRDKTTDEQAKLLDQYNAYAGHIATLFGKLIELFVTVAIQVIVLRFLADTFTRPEMSWKISALTLLLGAGVGYMISNGFNALNVQLRPQGIDVAIASADLGIDTMYDRDYVTNRSTWFQYTRVDAEAQPQNPVTNTMLRTLLVPTEPRRDSGCVRVDSSAETVESVEANFLQRGFPQRDWQGRILQQALASETLGLVVGGTDSINSTVLPMNASVATDLLVYALMIGPETFPWGAPYAFVNQSNLLQRLPTNSNSSASQSIVDNASRLLGLLPTDQTLDESTQRDWFLRESAAAVARQFATSSRTKKSGITMEFSHTQITPTIAFDAVTLDVELDPVLLATTASADNTTRYTVLNQIDDCPCPEHCMVRKPDYKVVDPMYDPPAQVFAYRLCTDANGTETLPANVTRNPNNSIVFQDLDCSLSDVDALLVVSIGKRLEADALEQNVSLSANGSVTTNASLATVTNLRKIYSFTVGQLSWSFVDLAAMFNAECRADTDYRGLEMPLGDQVAASGSSSNRMKQRLVVGRDRLPLYTLDTIGEELSFGKTDLLVLNEPPHTPKPSPLYRTIAGDLLLPHNIKTYDWRRTKTAAHASQSVFLRRLTITFTWSRRSKRPTRLRSFSCFKMPSCATSSRSLGRARRSCSRPTPSKSRSGRRRRRRTCGSRSPAAWS